MDTSNGAQTAPETMAITVVLTSKQTALMDEIAVAIRSITGRAISRSAMIRAIVAATLPHHRDWLKCNSEDELRQAVARRFQIDATVAQRAQMR